MTTEPLYPEEMLRRRSYIPPKAPITYAGMKQGWLGYLINGLQKQVVYDKFLDAFGGSGMSNLQFKHNQDAYYYVNDFHYANVCYYKILNGTNTEYSDFLDCIMLIQKCIKITVDNRKNKIWSDEKFNAVIKEFFVIYDSVSDVSKDTKKLDGVSNTFLNAVKAVVPECESFEFSCDTIIAAIFTAFGNMTVSGGMVSHVWNNTTGFTKMKRSDFKKIFDAVKKLYKDVEIVDKNGASAIDLLSDDRFNDSSVLTYADSPYIGTAEYNVSEGASESKYEKGTIIAPAVTGEEYISNDFSMDLYLDAIEKYQGNFIFSCRLNMPSPEPQAVVTGTFKKEEGGDLTENKVYMHFNNYVWFFRRWLKMDKIENYNMYCMVDTDWYLLSKKSILYYLNENNPMHYRPVNEEFKKRFINADWATNLSHDFKEKMYDYLRAVILCGQNYEIMITNFNADAPDFDSMYEHITNVYQKKNEPTSEKMKESKSGERYVKGNANTEILIPDNGKFVKIPFKLVAELVLTEFGGMKRTFEI